MKFFFIFVVLIFSKSYLDKKNLSDKNIKVENHISLFLNESSENVDKQYQNPIDNKNNLVLCSVIENAKMYSDKSTDSDIKTHLEVNSLIWVYYDSNEVFLRAKFRENGFVKRNKIKIIDKMSQMEQKELILSVFNNAKMLVQSSSDTSLNMEIALDNEFNYAELLTYVFPQFICKSNDYEVFRYFLEIKDLVYKNAEYSSNSMCNICLMCIGFIEGYIKENEKDSGIIYSELYELDYYARKMNDTNTMEYKKILEFYNNYIAN